MPDTGAPWNIPYIEPSDLVRDYPAANEDMADAIAAGLTAAGGLVAVKTAVLQGIFSASLASQASANITDLTITHTVADATNRILLIGYAGRVLSPDTNGAAGLFFAKDDVQLLPPTVDGVRTLMGSAHNVLGAENGALPIMAFDTPGTGSKVYTMRVINGRNLTLTLRINDTGGADNVEQSRAVSVMFLFEVSV